MRAARRLGALLGLVIVSAVAPAAAEAATLVNGDFENGDLSGWTMQAPTYNGWYVYTGTSSPNYGNPLDPPPHGDWAAVTEQADPGTQLLFQDVALSPGFAHQASMYVYYRTQVALTTQPTLDVMSPGSPAMNEQYRVDVMKPAAAADSVAPADVLLPIFGTQTGDPEELPPTLVTADLSQFAGQTVRLRFAETDNVGPLYASTDAVAITSLKLGKPKKNTKKGTAKLPVSTLESGTLVLEGRKVATRPKGGPLTVPGAGTANLLVKAQGAAKEKLNRKGKVKVTVKVTFTPALGAPLTLTKKVKLKKQIG